MELRLLFSSFSTTTTIIILHCITLCQSQNDTYYYDTCNPYTCGNVTVSFPFSSSETFCSLPGFEITCDSSSPTLTLSGTTYRVTDIHRADSIVMLSDPGLTDRLRSNSCDGLRSHFLPAANFTPFQLPSWGITLNFSFCQSRNSVVGCEVLFCDGGNESLYVLPPFGTVNGDSDLPSGCEHAAFPVQQANILRVNLTEGEEELLYVLADGFPVLWQNVSECWDCEHAGGRCGYNQSTRKSVCFCVYGCGNEVGNPGR